MKLATLPQLMVADEPVRANVPKLAATVGVPETVVLPLIVKVPVGGVNVPPERVNVLTVKLEGAVSDPELSVSPVEIVSGL